MRWLTWTCLFCLAAPLYASKPVKQLVVPPPGATLPVELAKTLRAAHLAPGQPVKARFIQRVPVEGGLYLPAKVELVGRVVQSTPSSLSLLFTQLRWKDQSAPIHVQLVAAASPEAVFDASMPEGSTDRSTSDPANWTTQQIGGEQVYRVSGSGGVYQYSQPVGYATLHGVYASPVAGGPPRALGPFSTDAAGLYGYQLSRFSIASPGGAGAPIRLASSAPRWVLPGGTALLLKVVAG